MRMEKLANQKEDIRFEEVYLSYFSKLKFFALEYVIREEDAENIVQDVFTELWERKALFTLQINLIAYLFTAVRNRCLNFLRHKTIIKETTDRIQEEYLLTLQINLNSLETFDQQLFSEEEIEKTIARALDVLPEKCRTIFIMSKIEGKKQREIASELKISIHTVETQIGIAYKKLREELKKYVPLFIFFLYL